MTSTIGSIAHGASPGRGDWKETLGRVGLVGKGVVFAIIGLLSIQLAMGDHADASQNGAIAWVAGQPFGKFLLVALTVSLFALAAWRFLDALVGDPVEGSEASDRAKYAIKGVLYLALAFASLSATVSNWSGESTSSSGGSGSQKATDTVLDWPGGQVLVVVVGLAVIAYALYQVKQHVIDQEFAERLDVSEDHWITVLGRFGYAARAVVYVMVGYFFVHAGLTYDPEDAQGLSKALQTLAGGGFGRVVLWFVAVGLIAYGVFTLFEAKHRKAA